MVAQCGRSTAESSMDDPDNDRSLRKHLGRNPKITKSIWESENYDALHRCLYDGMHWFFSSKNIAIMIRKSGRHRSVANAELRSNTFTRCSRHQHSVSLLHLSELDFWENTCAGNFSECSKQSLRVFRAHHDQVQAECERRVPVPDAVTGRWKRSRPELTQGPVRPAKDPLDEEDHLPQTSNKRAATVTATPAETNPSHGILDEDESDSDICMKAPVHWPVVCRNTTSPVRQIREGSRQPSACFTSCWEMRVMIWNM